MITRVYLVGFMGAGKTSVGRILADRLGWTALDLDQAIERREGRSVRKIFAEMGEAYFREVEAECLRQESIPDYRVVSLGGGTFVDARNRELIAARGLSIYLDAGLETILDRIEDDGSRPLLQSKEQVERLLAERRPLYRMAHKMIDTADKEPAEIAEEIVRALGES